MPDPITIITTLHGLAEKLVNSIKGGQDTAKAQEILRLVGQLQTEYFALQQRILKLESDNSKLVQKVETLQSSKAKEQHDDAGVVKDLDSGCTQALKILADPSGDATIHDLFSQLHLSEAKCQHLLDQLLGDKFAIQTSMNVMTGPRYGATPKGRDYLAKKGLL